MNQLFLRPFAETAPQPVHVVHVEFDGGAKGSPKPGHGNGYGSYQIRQEGAAHLSRVVRVDFQRYMSANVAEMLTVYTALGSVMKCFDAATVELHIHGDSRIALNRCVKTFKPKQRTVKEGKRSEDFIKMADALFTRCGKFARVETHWRGREASVKLFGH